MRVLVLGVDWHGDVALELCRGLEELGADAVPRYVLVQRRRGVLPRIEDELLATATFGGLVRRSQERRVVRATRAALEQVRPTLTVCLCPELMPTAAVELVSDRSDASWWFADDPFSPERRRLAAPPPVLRHIEDHGGRVLVAHPGWARGRLAGATYLPYGARYDHPEPAWRAAARHTNDCVVVATPRPERAQLLAQLRAALGDSLAVWGWGLRGRMPTNATTRPFRRSLRGGGVLTRGGTATVYDSAKVVLNLQDRQMLGAWSPQTFDLMALGVPQVAWNREPVDYLENPPAYADSAAELAELVHERLRGVRDDGTAAFDEVRRRHRWRHRAEAILATAS